jgi:hypothetical protein
MRVQQVRGEAMVRTRYNVVVSDELSQQMLSQKSYASP